MKQGDRFAVNPGILQSGKRAYGTAAHDDFDDWLFNQTCPVCKAETIYGDGPGVYVCLHGHRLRLELKA